MSFYMIFVNRDLDEEIYGRIKKERGVTFVAYIHFLAEKPRKKQWRNVFAGKRMQTESISGQQQSQSVGVCKHVSPPLITFFLFPQNP